MGMTVQSVENGNPGIVPPWLGQTPPMGGNPGIVPPWLTQAVPGENPGIVPPWLQPGRTPTAAATTSFVRTPVDHSPLLGSTGLSRF